MVVLAIIAGLLVIAAPGFLKLYASVRLSFDRKDLERQLLNLPREARESGTNEVLVDPAIADPAHEPVNVAEFESWKPVRLDLPKGWTMTVPKPIVYHFTGACDGGTVTFSFPPLSLSYVLTPPLCRPLPADASNQ